MLERKNKQNQSREAPWMPEEAFKELEQNIWEDINHDSKGGS